MSASVFKVMCLKILGRVGTHTFFIYFFWKKNIILGILNSPADAGLDLDLWYIENILTDYDSQHLQTSESS